MFKEYIQMSQKKDMDVGLYYAAKNLLDNYHNINDCLLLYETENSKSKLENAYFVFAKNKPNNERLKTANGISFAMLKGSLKFGPMENVITINSRKINFSTIFIFFEITSFPIDIYE